MTLEEPLFEHVYAVILAGGSGTRFWPLSRRRHPKQLLKLFGGRSLLEQTVDRIRAFIPPERTYVFTNELLRDQVVGALRHIPSEQIVAEPASRNTAPCLGLAAHEIRRRDPEGIMVALPSDHIIRKPAVFRAVLRRACRFAAPEGRSVILGLKPTEPHTGYGYVKLGPRVDRRDNIFRVERFIEKPPLPTARRLVASGEYLWNGGMFTWRASTLIRNLERFQPAMAAAIERIARSGGVRSAEFQRLYPALENISVDYALMEKIPDLYAAVADVGWSDVGSWSVVYDLSRKDRNGNARPAHSLCQDSKGNMIVSEGKFVVTVGTQNLVIVETDDALLVCQRERSQDVGQAVRELERKGFQGLL